MPSLRRVQPFLSLACILICLGCRCQPLVSSSMAPSIKPGEKVAVDYTAYVVMPPKRWDVVSFEPPLFTNQLWLMRVVALPGETVSFASDGITVNGGALVLPSHLTNVAYVGLGHPTVKDVGSRISSPYVVPGGRYFVLGDNSTNSNDSRMWGAVFRTNIFGKVRGK